MSVFLSIFLSVYLPNNLSRYLSLSTSLSLCIPVYLPTYPIYLSIYHSDCIPIYSLYLSVFQIVYRSIYLSIYFSDCISIYWSIHPSIQYIPVDLSIYPRIYLLIHLSINLSIHLSIHLQTKAHPPHTHPNGLVSYVPEMPQCSAAFCAATSESERPTRVTVGVMTRGVIQPIRRPINPGTNEKIGCSN